MKPNYIKINVKGGILSVGELRKVVTIAQGFNIGTIQIGERQDIMFDFDLSYQELVVDKMKESGLEFEFGTCNFPNIVSSYVSQGIFTNHSWMGEGLFRDILSTFDYQPKLKINISDPSQSLVPLFTGDINYLPSLKENYFHIYLHDPRSKSVVSPNWLVYVSDMARLSVLIEEMGMEEVLQHPDSRFNEWEAKFKLNFLPKVEKLIIPRHRFPYYVGMNKGEVDHWLGIYRRNNDFPVDFLKSVCDISSASGIGQVNLTAWRSLLIKGIKEGDRILWESVLSRYGINTRYSSNELNWQLADRDKEAWKIKNDLARDFTDRDIRTFGLTFAIVADKTPDINSTVVIYKKGALPYNSLFKGLSSYDIFITDNFQPNGLNYTLYEKNVPWSGLAYRLRNLSRRYFEKIAENIPSVAPKVGSTEKKVKEVFAYQCQHCLSIYHEAAGDPANEILPGTLFAQLPTTYECSLCGAGLSEFKKVKLVGEMAGGL
ncbi:MAG: rubredoxin [Cytophagales bacterium]|nr:rubredoxin [Cytophagales bacterium]